MKYIIYMVTWVLVNAWLWSLFFNTYTFEKWAELPIILSVSFYVIAGFAYIAMNGF